MVEAFDKFIELRSRKWLGEERVRSQFVSEFDIGNELGGRQDNYDEIAKLSFGPSPAQNIESRWCPAF